ncbi:MAG: monovalent cation:proton antiporter-2 (CPA2) family protein [Alphaproteobacteria bacterium]
MPAFDFSPLEIQFLEALALILMACVVVPVFKRIGLGSILGYIAAGVIVGASLTLGVTEHPEELLHFAEFGVVLFLFVIGLEMNPKKLWDMRGDIFGVGLAQVLVCGAALAVPPLLLGLTWQLSVVIGLGLALSSTALVMQALDEKDERGTAHGRKAFAILLFQDLAIVPLLLIVTLLAPTDTEMGLADGLKSVGIAVVAIGILIGTGRYLLNPVFRLLANAGVPEIMTAFALGIVIAAALLMDLAGMSYAMGAFVAGVMLAESSFRHELEANVEPFRGLFLGLFFVAVGASLSLQSVAANWLTIVIAVPAVLAIKAVAIYAFLRLFGDAHPQSVRAALSLPQAGEFGFVLFATAVSVGLLDAELSAILVAVITLTMALSPLCDRLAPYLVPAAASDDIDEDFSDAGDEALVIGFGRFGQVVTQVLRRAEIGVTILDADADRVREAQEFGSRIHFGDGTRRDVLRAAGAENAKLILVCVDDKATAHDIVRLCGNKFAQAKLLVRAFDRTDAIELIHAGIDDPVRETFESGLLMGRLALGAQGLDADEAAAVVDDVRRRDGKRMALQVDETAGSEADTLEAMKKIKPEPI